jgi:hypothetical protein
MKPTESYFIVHYGPKGTLDRDCRETGAIFSAESAMTRGLELKDEHGKAFITKRNRKGKIIQEISVLPVAKTAVNA